MRVPLEAPYRDLQRFLIREARLCRCALSVDGAYRWV